MRLDKFRGWGPWLAYASPSCFVLGIVCAVVAISFIPSNIKPSDPLPGGFIAFAILAFVLLGLWQVTMLAVAVDLEWIEHPLTHTGLTYVALGAAAVGTVGMILSMLSGFVHPPDFVGNLLGFLWLGGVGVYMLVINLVGRRAGVLRGGLPWLGMVAGAALLLVWPLTLTAFAPLAGLGMLLFILLYAVWSVWLGFALRGRAPAAPAQLAGQPA